MSAAARTSGGEANGVCRLAFVLLYGAFRGLPAWGLRRVRHTVIRYRLRRARRDSAPLASVLRRAKTVLVVCHGNIIRSAFAARLIERELGGRSSIAVWSAGTHAASGNPPHPTAVAVASALGLDLSCHVSTRLTARSVDGADAILVMDLAQLLFMRKRFPRASRKVFLLTGLAPDAPLEIRDPFGADTAVFQRCFDEIGTSVQAIVRVLCETPPRPCDGSPLQSRATL